MGFSCGWLGGKRGRVWISELIRLWKEGNDIMISGSLGYGVQIGCCYRRSLLDGRLCLKNFPLLHQLPPKSLLAVDGPVYWNPTLNSPMTGQHISMTGVHSMGAEVIPFPWLIVAVPMTLPSTLQLVRMPFSASITPVQVTLLFETSSKVRVKMPQYPGFGINQSVRSNPPTSE